MKTKWSTEGERILKVTQVRFRPVILARTTKPVPDSPQRPGLFSVMAQDCFIFPALKSDVSTIVMLNAWEKIAHSEYNHFPFFHTCMMGGETKHIELTA